MNEKKKCPICGSLVKYDEDNDLVVCTYCGYSWESWDTYIYEASAEEIED